MAVVVRRRARSTMALRKHLECLPFTAALLLLAITSEAARPSGNQAVGVGLKEGNTASLKQYLNSFGYLDLNKFGLDDLNDGGHDLESAVKNFQMTYNLKPTGVVDEQTKQLMMKPRCGHTDTGMDLHNTSVGPRSQHRILEEVIKYPASKRNLTYWIDSRKTGGIPFEVLSSLYSRITSAWSKVSHFTFKEVNDIPDILTAVYDKVDPQHQLYCGEDTFDKLAKNLMAHAMCRPWSLSFIHVRSDNQWATVAPANSTQNDLENTLLHEMGHVLGLPHSSDPKAIMYAIGYPGEKKLHITDTDVNMLKALYGADF